MCSDGVWSFGVTGSRILSALHRHPCFTTPAIFAMSADNVNLDLQTI